MAVETPFAAPVVTNQRRDRFGRELVVALIPLYMRSKQAAYEAVGAGRAQLTPQGLWKLSARATDRAAKMQSGMNEYIARTVEELPEGATTLQMQQALDTLEAEVTSYNDRVLKSYLASFTDHEGMLDGYQEGLGGSPAGLLPEGDRPYDALGDMLWTWTQKTDYEDECQEADGMGAASLDDIMAVTGGAPPRHEHCDCDLDPA